MPHGPLPSALRRNPTPGPSGLRTGPTISRFPEPCLQNVTIQERGQLGGNKKCFWVLMEKWEFLGPKIPKMHFFGGGGSWEGQSCCNFPRSLHPIFHAPLLSSPYAPFPPCPPPPQFPPFLPVSPISPHFPPFPPISPHFPPFPPRFPPFPPISPHFPPFPPIPPLVFWDPYCELKVPPGPCHHIRCHWPPVRWPRAPAVAPGHGGGMPPQVHPPVATPQRVRTPHPHHRTPSPPAGGAHAPAAVGAPPPPPPRTGGPPVFGAGVQCCVGVQTNTPTPSRGGTLRVGGSAPKALEENYCPFLLFFKTFFLLSFTNFY